MSNILLQQASNQLKVKKSKLLIYDEYLKKYVSADELLIPGEKGINEGAVTRKKSKELFIFDVLIKKFVNPKLDLLVPGVKSLDLVIKNGPYNKQDFSTNSSKDYFWRNKTSKKRAVCPLPPVHTNTSTDTEPPKLGWAGQRVQIPQSDPRPEMGKPECKLGPGKEPKKKKPTKKKSKKNKYLICDKKKEPQTNVKDGINKTVAEQTTKKSSKDSKEIVYNEENCYSNLKETGKSLKQQDSINNETKPHFKSFVKEEIVLNNLMEESEKNKSNDDGVFKIICSKLFTNEINEKEPTIRENTSDPPDKTTISDQKANYSLNRNEKGNKDTLKQSIENKPVIKHESNLTIDQSKALVCKQNWPSSLIPIEQSKTTNLYLCKEQKEKPKNESSLGQPKSVCSKKICLSATASTNKINSHKIESFNNAKEEKEGVKISNTYACLNKAKVDDCSQSTSIKDSSLDNIKQECKQAITQRPNTTPTETPGSSKLKDRTTLKNTQNDVNKSRTSPYDFKTRPKTAHLQKPCSKAGSLTTSKQSKGDLNKDMNILPVSKSDHAIEEPCKCAKVEKSKVVEKCNETNGREKHKSLELDTSKCLKIDLKSTEKLQCIAQEEFFKKADFPTDLTKCSSYLGFKVKTPTSKTKLTKENSLKGNKNVCNKSSCKEVDTKKKDKSKTVVKTSSCNDSLESKTECNSCRASKSESVLTEEPTKQTLHSKPQDMQDSSKNSLCKDGVSLANDKQESKSTTVCGSDAKNNLKNRKHKLSKKKSSTKTSKKSKSKSTLDVKSMNLKRKKVEKNKKSVCTSNKGHSNMEPNEKSSLCTKPSAGSESKNRKENIKQSTGKDGSCPTLNDCQHKPDKETIQCCKANEEKPKETKIDKKDIEEHTSKETNEKKKKDKPKDYLKHIVTGAKSRKKTHCKKSYSFQTLKSQGNANKSKNKNSSKEPQTIEEPSKEMKKSKSAKICSKKKSSISIDEIGKQSKSKHSVGSKTDKGSIAGKKTSKSKKGESLTKLNKLVQKAKCNTAIGIKKEKSKMTHALVCSNSTPNIQTVKHNKISVLSNPNKATPKKRSTSNTSNNTSKNLKASKSKMKNSKICSLHTLQKRMTDTPIKTSERIDSKSFSELKTVNSTSGKNISDERFNNSSYYSPPIIPWNKEKIEKKSNAECTVVTEEHKIQCTEQKTERNSLKMPNWAKSPLIDPKTKNFSPSLKIDKYFQILLSSITHKSEANKYEPKETLKLVTKASKNDSFVVGRNGQTALVSNSPNSVKEYFHDGYKVCEGKNKCQNNSIPLFSKNNTIIVDKSHKTTNIKKLETTLTEDARQSKKETRNLSKIINKCFQENIKLEKGTLSSNAGNGNSIIKRTTKETFFTEQFCNRDGSTHQPNQAAVSKVQLKAGDISNTDEKSVKQTGRTRSAASTKSCNNALSVPHKTVNPCKTKSFSSFNALKLHETVTKHAIRPSQLPKKETNKDFEMKTVDSKPGQNQESIFAKISYSPQNKTPEKSQLQFKTAANKTSQIPKESSFHPRFSMPTELQKLQVNTPKPVTKTNDSTSQTNRRRNDVSNETILCDFIEGSSDVNVQNTETQFLGKNKKYIINQPRHLKELKNIKEVEIREQEKKKTDFINIGKNSFKYNDLNKKESSTFARSTLKNKAPLIDTLEKHVSKLENIVPSMKRIFKPVYLNSGVSAGNKDKELNKNTLTVNTPVKDNTLEKTINKVAKTEKKIVKETNNIRKKEHSVLDETAYERKLIKNGNNTCITLNNTEKLPKITIKKCDSDTLSPNVEKDKVRQNNVLKQVTTKTSVIGKYSPKLKNKMKLISERHRKFTNFSFKKPSSAAAKIDSGSYEKSEAKDTIKTHSGMSNKNNNTEHRDNKTHFNIATTMSKKQTQLLMEQPFYKKPTPDRSTDNGLHISKSESSLAAFVNKDNAKVNSPPKAHARQPTEQPSYKQPKSKPSTDNGLHFSKPETNLAAFNKDNAKGISSPKHTTKQPTEQLAYKQPKPEVYNENLCNSKSENNLPKPKHFIKRELHSLKSEYNLVATNKNNASVISPRKQQSSIRSQLRIKTPKKAETVLVNLKKTEQD